MLSFLRTFFAVLLAFAFVAAIPIFLLLVLALAADTTIVENDSWLVIEMTGALPEYYPPVTLRSFVEEIPPCLMEVTENLEKAAADDRILGVVLRLEGFEAGSGKIQEMHDGIRLVQDAGKPVYAYSSFLTDAGLLVGSACDSILVFPKGRVALLGPGATIPHLKGVLEKLDVNDQVHRIAEYKSAAELFAAKESSKETIENLTWLLEDLLAMRDSTLSSNRGVDPEDVVAWRERALFTAWEAVEAGVVDDALFWDELEERLAGGDDGLRQVSSADYSEVPRNALGLGGRTKVAVVHAQGFVASGFQDGFDPVLGMTMGGDRVVEDLREAQEDDDIDAIILRWDTGGGLTDSSQRIARAVALASATKPVVVSMADEAASGGYMMSYPADVIVCPEAGITGSIGSVTGKLNVRGMWEKLGLTFDDVPFAPNAYLFSDLHDFTDEQWRILEHDHWAGYNDWIDDISRARDMTFEDVDAVSRGRVWTGRQARERGLVDELGGFRHAVAITRGLADLEEDASVSFVHFPARKSLIELAMEGRLSDVVRSTLVREASRSLVSAAPGGLMRLHWEPLRIR